ncbi:fimbrial biogenesis chaperone [Acinetobacter larvae]|uniref:Pilus assembly protein n=1 Tax=Acinetobacter larvae TaxID=1789224 RepID=A0A1B2M0H0_9GAMM|nr:fimbria/pilus periplasmic chaperone [Acinetobacter larvae]AOA58704.1 hypothetical protein BFG52_10290 [Acinetobacter larvae]
MFAKPLLSAAKLLAVMAVFSTAHAGIVIGGTRIVYPSNQKTVTVQVKNQGNNPALMQTWIDNGNADLAPDEIDVPFSVMPPVSRIDSKVGQNINISYLGGNLAEDRESIFWLNVLDIPAMPNKSDIDENSAVMQIAVRSRIKLFYRPAHLEKDAEYAADKIVWQVVANQLIIKNPTAYYMNISSIDLELENDNKKEILTEGAMIEPFSEQHFPIENVHFKKFKANMINDFGGIYSLEVNQGN